MSADELDESLHLYRQGRAAMEAGKLEEAIEHFSRSVGLAPHFKTLELQGECLLQLGRPADAIEPLRLATEENPQVRAPSLLAEALLAVGDLESARSIAEGVLAQSPANRRALSVLERLASQPPRGGRHSGEAAV